MRSENTGGGIVNRVQVRLAGRVTAADGAVATGGTLWLTPAEGARISRRFETSVRSDGFYFFLNLPAGAYLLGGKDEHGNEIENVRVSISVPKGQGHLDVVTTDLRAPTQTAAGEQMTEAKASIAPARRGRGFRRTVAGNPHE